MTSKILPFPKTKPELDALDRFRKSEVYADMMRLSLTLGPEAVDKAFLYGRLQGLTECLDLFKSCRLSNLNAK